MDPTTNRPEWEAWTTPGPKVGWVGLADCHARHRIKTRREGDRIEKTHWAPGVLDQEIRTCDLESSTRIGCDIFATVTHQVGRPRVRYLRAQARRLFYLMTVSETRSWRTLKKR